MRGIKNLKARSSRVLDVPPRWVQTMFMNSLQKRRLWVTIALAVCVVGIWSILIRDLSDLFQQQEQPVVQEAFLPNADWLMFRGDPSLQGYIDADLPSDLFLEWIFEAKDAIKSSAAVVGGKVFFGSDDGCVYALNAETGGLLWLFKTGDGVESSPCVLEDKVFVGSNNGFLYALNAHDGSEIWKYETEDRIAGGVNWFADLDSGNKRVLVGSYDSRVYCLDAETGELLWSHETGNYINGMPAISDGKVVFGGCDALVHAVAVEDGTPLAQIDTGSYIPGSAALVVTESDGSSRTEAFVGHYGNEVLRIDLNRQAIIWRYQGSAAFFSSPAVSSAHVVVGARDRKLHCLARETGESVWTFATQANVDCAPIIARNRVIFGSDDGRLYIVGLADGGLIWSYDVGKAIKATPALAAGRVFVGSEDGRMYAFRPGAGKETSR